MLDSTVVCRRALGCEWGGDKQRLEVANRACNEKWPIVRVILDHVEVTRQGRREAPPGAELAAQ